MPHYVYILQSETTKQYYVGESVDVAARLLKHNAKSTTSTKTRGSSSLYLAMKILPQ
ncbi:GIY-YIG nuclease family protein [Chitinophaga sp. CCNWLW40]|uniref:GIY-YIG nuclease family protein n=1 Tax=unclassified Chitinophaga TaxID=2619133 RepID=UPI0038B3F58E